MINGVDCHRDNTCASHMPILMEFINMFKPKSILEVGCGYYSTKLFLENASTLISIESVSNEWYEKMNNFYEDYLWTFLEEYEFGKILSLIEGQYDLIFIDGDINRAEQVNHSFKHSNSIVVHDSQGPWNEKIKKPDNFYERTFVEFPIEYDEAGNRPWTTLFTNEDEVIDHFVGPEKYLYEKYKFPYLYEECPN